ASPAGRSSASPAPARHRRTRPSPRPPPAPAPVAAAPPPRAPPSSLLSCDLLRCRSSETATSRFASPSPSHSKPRRRRRSPSPAPLSPPGHAARVRREQPSTETPPQAQQPVRGKQHDQQEDAADDQVEALAVHQVDREVLQQHEHQRADEGADRMSEPAEDGDDQHVD